jgi:hypothetical protein
MRNLLLGLLALMTSMAQAIEEPAHEVIRSLDAQVELRRCAPCVVAEVVLDTRSAGAGNQAFPILAGYIFGQNKGQRKLQMTAPVTQSAEPVKLAMTAPVTQAAAGGGTRVHQRSRLRARRCSSRAWRCCCSRRSAARRAACGRSKPRCTSCRSPRCRPARRMTNEPGPAARRGSHRSASARRTPMTATTP